MIRRLLDLLVDGVFLALPLGAAAFLLHKVVGLLALLLAPATHLLPNGRWFGIAAVEFAAILVLIVVLLVLGVFARSSPGRRFRAAIERVVLARIPGYRAIRSIASDLAGVEEESGMRPALVSLDDNAVLAFVVEESADKAMITVFVPAAPGAATGSVMLVPAARVQRLEPPTKGVTRALKQRGVGLQALAANKPRN
jgi:uncharacterized membrane protein